MKKMLAILLALAFCMCITPTASAQQRFRFMRRRPPVRFFQPMQTNVQPFAPMRNAFGNLMELERRKNAWLMQTFFRR